MRKTYALIDKYEVIFLLGYLSVVAAVVYAAILLSKLFG